MNRHPDMFSKLQSAMRGAGQTGKNSQTAPKKQKVKPASKALTKLNPGTAVTVIALAVSAVLMFSSCDLSPDDRYRVIYSTSHWSQEQEVISETLVVDTNWYFPGQSAVIRSGADAFVMKHGEFYCWEDSMAYDSVNTALYFPGETITISYEDVKLKPIFTTAKKVICHANYPDGVSPPSTASSEPAAQTAVPSLPDTWEVRDYIFAGWNTQEDSNGESFQPGDAVVLDESFLELYAVWKPGYRVHYHMNSISAKVPNDESLYSEGDAAAVFGKPEPSASGEYYFAGWNTDPEGLGPNITPGSELIIAEGDIDLYAVWQKKYSIGDQGPAGGRIFLDTGSWNMGWRYLEALPENSFSTALRPLGTESLELNTADYIGAGFDNTKLLQKNSNLSSDEYAVSWAYRFKNNCCGKEFDDWFIPSRYEMKRLAESRSLLIDTELVWSSSTENGKQYYVVDFRTGEEHLLSAAESRAQLLLIRCF
ncbi:MAG: InlB B-repeat-containing protein [Spirochaetia bacterium]|nr:InlB B-repeat-containing protein [Spirochaetia bacterium]